MATFTKNASYGFITGQQDLFRQIEEKVEKVEESRHIWKIKYFLKLNLVVFVASAKVCLLCIVDKWLNK